MTRVVSIQCPHCESKVRAVKSRPMSPLMKEITYQCSNAECGHVFVATLEVSRTISLSSTPNPEVKIPISQHIRQAAESQISNNTCICPA